MSDLFKVLPSGCSHLQNFIDHEMQKELTLLCRGLCTTHPLMTPRTVSGYPLSLKVTSWGKVGWFGSEGKYQYLEHHANGKRWPPIPEAIRILIVKAARHAGFFDLDHEDLDTVLLNYYLPQTGKLGRHQDVTEEDRVSPIVTISLGDSCIFNVGSTDYADKGTDIELRSGDTVVMGGASRLAYHGVVKVLPNTSDLLAKGGRISLTGRKVFK